MLSVLKVFCSLFLVHPNTPARLWIVPKSWWNLQRDRFRPVSSLNLSGLKMNHCTLQIYISIQPLHWFLQVGSSAVCPLHPRCGFCETWKTGKCHSVRAHAIQMGSKGKHDAYFWPDNYPSPTHSCKTPLNLSLSRVTNVPQQPHQKHYIKQYEESGFS